MLKRVDTSNYEVDKLLPKKVIELIKDELAGQIMVEFIALRPKTHSYLMDDGGSIKKAKGTKQLSWKEYLSLLIIVIPCLITSQYYNQKTYLKVKHIMYILNKDYTKW